MKALVAILALVGGCTVADAPAPEPESGRDGTTDTTDEEPAGELSTTSPTGYLTAIAQIYCEQAFTCRATYPYDAAAFEATWTTSVPECITHLVTGWNAHAIEAEIAKGRAEFDGTAAVACLGGVAFGSCAEHWQQGIQWVESCYYVIVGNVTAGGTCDTDYACVSSFCDLTTHRCL